jgi:hypothetical protein
MVKDRIQSIILAGVLAMSVCALPAWAGPAEPAVNAHILGLMESVAHYCGSIDAASAAALQDKIAALVKGASSDALEQARESTEYKQAYQSVAGMFTGQDAKRVCTQSAGTPAN